MSEIEKDIDKANKIGNLLNSWTKIIIVVGGAVISCGLAYYKIFENEKDIILEKKERIENYELLEERSDKRYLRAMETASELKEYIKYQQEEIIKIKEKNAYLEGYIKGKEYNEKNK